MQAYLARTTTGNNHLYVTNIFIKYSEKEESFALSVIIAVNARINRISISADKFERITEKTMINFLFPVLVNLETNKMLLKDSLKFSFKLINILDGNNAFK